MWSTIERPVLSVDPGGGVAAGTHTLPPVDWLRSHPVVVATDGSPAADSAVRVTAALAELHGVVPHAIRVLAPRDPLEYLAGDSSIALAIPDEASAPDRVRDELARLLGIAPEWPFRIEVGAPAPVIRGEAARLGAALLVVGLRRHGMFERIARDETVLQVMRGAPCPVLGVRASLAALPQRAVVGVDFSRASVRAVRAAYGLLPSGGTLVLAHVDRLAERASERMEGEGIVHTLGVQAAFSRIRSELSRRTDVRVELAVLENAAGPAAVGDELLSLAARAGAELLAVGTHRRGRLERWMLGSVTRQVVRDGRCSLLVVPPYERAGTPEGR